MIRRSVRKNFRAVYWDPPTFELRHPTVFFANHHGWYDGYLMFHAVEALGVRCLDWIQEYDAFPLFGSVGGLPFPVDDPGRRAATIRKTVRALKSKTASLVLFPEQPLHYPPDVHVFGAAMELLARQVPEVVFCPVAIRYEFALHERAEGFLRFGAPVPLSRDLLTVGRDRLVDLLNGLVEDIRTGREFPVLAHGTKSVNERWDMRRFKR